MTLPFRRWMATFSVSLFLISEFHTGESQIETGRIGIAEHNIVSLERNGEDSPALSAGQFRSSSKETNGHSYGSSLPGGSSSRGNPSSSAPLGSTQFSGPQFVKEASKNVTALKGKTAYLNCRVKNLENWTVSWIRHRDLHLIAVGRYTYTADQRFRPVHRPHFEELVQDGVGGTEADGFRKAFPIDSAKSYGDWGLEIHSTQHRDAGIYDCQISTTPHRSLFIHLRVVEPSTTILGALDVFVDKGSTINLTCVIRLSPEPPQTIGWRHNNQLISYDSARGGVSVVTEKGIESSSSLLIQNARPSDSGKYTCLPENAEPASVNVHVLNGESPAAMQHGSSPEQLSSSSLFASTVVIAILQAFLPVPWLAV